MKIVCISDMLLTETMYQQAVNHYPRYDTASYFHFSPADRGELRSYVRNMEQNGPLCAPLPREILRSVEDADVIQSHLAPLPAEVFARARKVKIVASNRGGYENIDVDAATRHGVPVICNPAHNANAVAEMTVGMILAETRNIARCHAAMAVGKKWREAFPNSGRIRELQSSTIGIIGFGEIGRRVAAMLRVCGARLLVFDPYVDGCIIEKLGGDKVEIDQLLSESDIVTLHARAVRGAKPLLGKAELEKMKPTAVLVNTARASLVDMDALYAALKKQKIGGAAIDVYPAEPVPEDHPLLTLDNVTLSCHKGGDTVESYANSPRMVLEEVERFFAGQQPKFCVNPETLRESSRWRTL